MPEAKPLAGKRILVTRPAGRGGPLIGRLESLGARAISFPVIRIEPFADLSRLDRALARLETYDWVVFTSAQAVDITWARLPHPAGAQQLAGRRLAAIGPATARCLEQHGLPPTLVPEEFVAEGLIDALGDVDGRHILLPRAEGARELLPRSLADRGAHVDEVPIYRAVPAKPDDGALDEIRHGIDAFTLTSPSTVRAFGSILAVEGLDPLRLPGDPACVCIGPITAAAATAAGYRPAVVAKVYTTDGLVDALCSYFLEG
ncbi:MAG TPA: uroporphyrinogen-III synthase [Anaerolineales bacterium]|nr:uroporphyrinogen-III synthase [Anaerolineales bacterium]